MTIGMSRAAYMPSVPLVDRTLFSAPHLVGMGCPENGPSIMSRLVLFRGGERPPSTENHPNGYVRETLELF